MNEFEAIHKRVASMPPSQLRSDALDLVGALRAQALLITDMAATAQAALNEGAALRQKLAAANARAEAAERQRDAFEQWSDTLEACGWQDAGKCPHCEANDVRRSTDVLEPDVAKFVCYCGSCRRAWLENEVQA